jgi:outer membrane protein OmpA-like peptidoglycan-associated protein
MSTVFGLLGKVTIRSAFAAGIALSLSAGFAIAGDATEDQILKALTPKRLTRSLSAPPAETAKAAEETKLVNQIRNRTTRSLSAGEREQIATIAQEKPSIDLEITFDYNSANLSQKAMPAVAALGKALTNPELKGTTFVLAGHTDAKGGDSYNQDLSERRADTLKKYLMEKYGIAAADLVTVGYGKTKLKNAANPEADENRRVQVVNMASSKVAGN